MNIPTISGKVDYGVERAIHEIAAQVNGLEQQVLALQRTVAQINIGAILGELQRLQARVEVLAARE